MEATVESDPGEKAMWAVCDNSRHTWAVAYGNRDKEANDG